MDLLRYCLKLVTIFCILGLQAVCTQEDSDQLLSSFRIQDLGVSKIEIDLGITDNEYRTHGDTESRAELMTCEKAREIWEEPSLKATCEQRSSLKTRFSSIDGSCNNIQKPYLGKSRRPFHRILVPDYCDGKQMPRCSATGSPLPNARSVSSKIQSGDPGSSKYQSAMLMQWGQYISHDFSFTPVATDERGQKLVCHCEMSSLQSCFNILISVKDDDLKRNVGCMPFPRSAGTVPDGCIGGVYREQVNQITSYVDASTVYGSTRQLLDTLSNEGHSTMEVSNSSTEHLLPDYDMISTNFSGKFKCPGPESHGKCFAAGDFRVNETPTLTLVHLLWVREHNRIARRLAEINPGWSNRRIFWEARQVVIAQHQHITYSEYMKDILGDEMALSIYDGEALSRYSPDVDPSVSNVFATAAFRFGHSQITDQFIQAQPSSASTSSQLHPINSNLDIAFFNPSSLYNSTVGPRGLVSCLLSTPGNKMDGEFSHAVRNRLFANGSGPGLDLLALNIQRGRDHGIPGYNRWRQWCGFTVISSMQQLDQIFTKQQSNSLQYLYKSVEDIDLYVGGLLESPVHGGTVGPTFACIMKNQFLRLKRGDRFWFDNAPPNAVFTEEQVRELRKSTLSKVICNNMPQITKIQSSSMRLPNKNTNNPVPCNQLQDIDLIKWEDSLNAESEESNFNPRPSSPRRLLPIVSGWGGIFLSNTRPTITLCSDESCTSTLQKGSRKRIGETVFIEVGYDERLENYLKQTVPALTGIEVTECTAYSESGSKYRQQTVQLIMNGCPNRNIGIPISISRTSTNFRFRFRYQNFLLRGQNVNIGCSIRLCFKNSGQDKNCLSKVC